MNRDVEQNGALKTCEKLGIGFVPWGPIGQGYLTRKIDAQTTFDPKLDVRSTFPRFSPETISANTPIIELVKKFAEKMNASAAQLCLAWLLARKPFIVPIPGTRNVDHLNEIRCSHPRYRARDYISAQSSAIRANRIWLASALLDR